LLAPGAASQEHQPYLVELFAIKLHSGLLNRIGDLHIRCKPPIDMPEQAIKIHGITDADVKAEPSFISIYDKLYDFFSGAEIFVCHNVGFDKMVLYWELYRRGKVLNFPWAKRDICTVEISQQMKGYRMTLVDLYIELFGEGFTGAHSASVDCEMTMKCFVELVRRELIK